MRRDKKNISKKGPNGTVVRTRDEYFEGSSNYRKPGYENKGLYRAAVVVDSNSDDELALVKLLGGKGTILLHYEKGKSGYKAFVETLDDGGDPIKLGKKFARTAKKHSVSGGDVTRIKKDLVSHHGNRKKLHKLKKRK